MLEASGAHQSFTIRGTAGKVIDPNPATSGRMNEVTGADVDACVIHVAVIAGEIESVSRQETLQRTGYSWNDGADARLVSSYSRKTDAMLAENGLHESGTVDPVAGCSAPPIRYSHVTVRCLEKRV